ncbi:uracil-5--methyltransferase TRM9 [Amniculicola lignicola CBS 123094]|uniref:Uracil-5--methyltransferase TRM9 n=1 Tax=Amniculicola lignicola CBS 123094 TaxID=1392246 RepID=A0A6A5W779_9PLEO|nr:uracil-5--methyltransferase TRM9 [Amniculicola lignicola CBS 123094]
MTDSEPRGEGYEAQHVHSVYEEIASHFSSTRYKPWPIVERFLKELPDGSIGADVGCGNGKYLAVNKKVFIVGSDRSTNLIKIAKEHQPHAAVVADNLSLPHPFGCFDFAISIAVIHHLSTPERRVEAVQAVLNLLRPPSGGNKNSGRVLIYVWALEQKDSRRGWDEGHEQDVMVPWVLKSGERTKKEKGQKTQRDGVVNSPPEETVAPAPKEDKTFLRYYHLYRKEELEHDIDEAGGTVLESGYEKDNWWAIASPRQQT